MPAKSQGVVEFEGRTLQRHCCEGCLSVEQLNGGSWSYSTKLLEDVSMASSSDFDPKGAVEELTDHTKRTIDDATQRAQNAASQVGAVSSNLSKAIDKSLREQPYTTLALAGMMGFVFGALWKS